MSEVYFILAPDLGLVKIGFAADARKRFSKVQSDSPSRLQLIAIEPAPQSREFELHKMFDGLRTRGEWFRHDEPLTQYIHGLSPYEYSRQRKKLGGALGEWLYGQNITLAEFAASVGVSHAQVSRCCSGHSRPSLDLAHEIELKTNGAVPMQSWVQPKPAKGLAA